MNFQELSKLLPKLPVEWNIEDVGIWLQFIGLENLRDNFSNNLFYKR